VKAFYDAIRFIYPAWYLPYNSSAFKQFMTFKVIKDHYDSLSVRYHYKVIPPHDEMIQVARFLRKDPKRLQDAIELLKMNSGNYSTSTIAYEQLADTYLLANDTANARVTYEKAIALDKNNQQLQQKLANLNP
jgi:hypothetical protein